MVTMSLVVDKLLAALCISAQWTFASESDTGRVMTASSNGFAFEVYSVPGLAEGFRVTSVTLIKQHSSSDCIHGHSYGHNKTKIWVDKGCRGDFLVQTNKDADITNPISTSTAYLAASTLLPTQAIQRDVDLLMTSTTESKANEPEFTSHNFSLQTSDVDLHEMSSLSTRTIFEKTTDSPLTRTASASDRYSTGLDHSPTFLSSEDLSSHTITSLVTSIRLESTTVELDLTSANEFPPEPSSTSKEISPADKLVPQGTSHIDKPPSQVDVTSTLYTMSTSTLSPMQCCCNRTGANINQTERYISEIVKRLQIDVKRLSRNVRRKISVSDHRSSSTSLGIAGLVFLIVVPVLLVLSDVVRLDTRQNI